MNSSRYEYDRLWVVLIIALFVILAVTAKPAQGQVISTAETGGVGKTTYLGSLNINRYAGTDGSGGYIWIGHGVSDRFDVFTIDGWSTVPGETQFWVGAGTNFRLSCDIGCLTNLGIDMSFYQYLTTPITRRKEASTMLYDAALLASMHVGKTVPYIGINAIVPIGNKHQSTFTPPQTEINFPAGIAIPAGKTYLYLEADFGEITIYSVGLSYTR